GMAQASVTSQRKARRNHSFAALVLQKAGIKPRSGSAVQRVRQPLSLFFASFRPARPKYFPCLKKRLHWYFKGLAPGREWGRGFFGNWAGFDLRGRKKLCYSSVLRSTRTRVFPSDADDPSP